MSTGAMPSPLIVLVIVVAISSQSTASAPAPWARKSAHGSPVCQASSSRSSLRRLIAGSTSVGATSAAATGADLRVEVDLRALLDPRVFDLRRERDDHAARVLELPVRERLPLVPAVLKRLV